MSTKAHLSWLANKRSIVASALSSPTQRASTNAATAGAFAELALHGLPDSWYARYADSIRKVTAKDVRAAAKSTIPSSKMVFAVVGDMAKVRPDLEKLGLGEPELRDNYGVPILTTNK